MMKSIFSYSKLHDICDVSLLFFFTKIKIMWNFKELLSMNMKSINDVLKAQFSLAEPYEIVASLYYVFR